MEVRLRKMTDNEEDVLLNDLTISGGSLQSFIMPFEEVEDGGVFFAFRPRLEGDRLIIEYMIEPLPGE